MPDKSTTNDWQIPPDGDGTDGGDLTNLLQAHALGDQRALNLLVERVYQELRIIAVGQLRGESANPLMGPTALVNEAYLRLVGQPTPSAWANRRHFFAAACEAMRRVLVDQARQRLALKRGGAAVQIPLEDDISIPTTVPDEELLDLDDALLAFSQFDAEKAELVKLRYFVGLSEAQTAETLGISRPTASRYWTFARAWLFDWLRQRGGSGQQGDL